MQTGHFDFSGCNYTSPGSGGPLSLSATTAKFDDDTHEIDIAINGGNTGDLFRAQFEGTVPNDIAAEIVNGTTLRLKPSAGAKDEKSKKVDVYRVKPAAVVGTVTVNPDNK